MPFIKRSEYVRGLAGISHASLVIGSATVSDVLAIPQEDVAADNDDSRQPSAPYYQLNLPLGTSVRIGDAVTIPISDSLQFAGSVTDLDVDIVRDCTWAVVRGAMGAVSP